MYLEYAESPSLCKFLINGNTPFITVSYISSTKPRFLNLDHLYFWHSPGNIEPNGIPRKLLSFSCVVSKPSYHSYSEISKEFRGITKKCRSIIHPFWMTVRHFFVNVHITFQFFRSIYDNPVSLPFLLQITVFHHLILNPVLQNPESAFFCRLPWPKGVHRYRLQSSKRLLCHQWEAFCPPR